MPDVLKQLGISPRAEERGSLLSQLGLEGKVPGKVSSPLLPRPTLMAEQLKTMELEGIPVGKAITPSPFVGEPVTGKAAVPVDIAEAVGHLVKGIAAVPAVGLESAGRLGLAVAAGLPIDEALMEAEKAGGWLGPGPATPAAMATGEIATIPHKTTVAAVEAIPEVPETPADLFMDFVSEGRKHRKPLIPVSEETARKLSVAVKTTLGTLVELGMYGLIAKAIHRVAPKKKARLTVEEIEKVVKEVEPEFPSAEEIKALRLKKREAPEIVPTQEELSALAKKGVADVVLMKIAKELKLPEKKAAKIPAFKTTNEAAAFGEKATPEQVKRMEVLRGRKLKEVEKLRGEDKGEEALVKAVEAQFLKEAVDASTGDLVIMRKSTKPEVVAEPTAPKAEPISDVVKSSEEGLVASPPEVVPPHAPEPSKLSDRIHTLFNENKDAPEIAKNVKMSEEAVAMALQEMKLSRGKKLVTMKEVEAEARAIMEKAKDLDDVHKKMQELTTRYEENIDAGFADNFELERYREWGDELIGKVVDARRKAGLVPEPDPEAPLSIVTKEGVRETFTDPTDKGGFSTAKAAEMYRKLNPDVGEVIENPNAPGQFVLRTRPEVTLETGGFQSMYEAFVDRLKTRGGGEIKPEAVKTLDRGKIIKQRKVKGRIYPPVYEAQLEILKGCRKLPQTITRRTFQNPIRTFEDAGGQALLDLTVHEYHARDSAIDLMRSKFRKDRKAISKGLKRKERERIMIHAIASEKNGMPKLELMGYKMADLPKLNAREKVAYDTLRARYEAWYTRLNRVRKAIGKEPFPYTENYFTFIRDLSWLERIEANPFDMSAADLNAQFVKMGATPFRFAKPRSNARYRLEMDPFHVLEIYEDSAIAHIQLSPLIAQLRELQLSITDPVSGKPFLLQNENPVLNSSLHSWTNHIAGMKSPTWKLSPEIESVMMRVNGNLAAAILGANVRSAMIQVTALRNTWTEIGIPYTMRGVLSLIDPAKRNFAMKKSKVLRQRAYEVVVEDALRGIRAGRIGEAQKVAARVALKPLQILDLEWAKASWQGAYEYAKGPLKFSESKARIYADDVVTMTQASARPGDIAPIQRFVAGKCLTLFQTFTINDWSFLVKDVARVGREGPFSKLAFKKAMRYIAATTAFNILMEDGLKIQSPFPTPIRAFRESLENGDDFPSLAWNVSKEFIEPIPLIGAARYGKDPFGPTGELVKESIEFARRDPMAPEWWELVPKWLGVPGTAQTAKTLRARKRGETTYGQVVGTYTKSEPKMKELKGLEGLETMSMP